MTVLNEHQTAVSERVLSEECDKRRHLVVALSGAHAYGFPSPDSDLDLKAIHIAPTTAFLGLETPRLTFDRMEVIDGVEIDYTSNELQMALAGILKGNGNYLERVLGPIQLRTSPELTALRPLVEKSLSRRAYHHYRGFATSQLAEFEKAEAPMAKKLLYVLRTTLTGAHLLATGRLVTDLTELLDDYEIGEARALIEAKRSGERATLGSSERERWRGQIARLFEMLEKARDRSPLPEEPENRKEIEGWLIAVRRLGWGDSPLHRSPKA